MQIPITAWITPSLYHSATPKLQFSRNIRLFHRRIATFSAHRDFFGYGTLVGLCFSINIVGVIQID